MSKDLIDETLNRDKNINNISKKLKVSIEEATKVYDNWKKEYMPGANCIPVVEKRNDVQPKRPREKFVIKEGCIKQSYGESEK